MIDLEKLRALGTHLVNLDSESGEGKLMLAAVAEVEQLRALLNDEEYIQMRADYSRGQLSWCNMINERERGLNKPRPPTAAEVRGILKRK